jgi:aliphatic sulfonates family ABC transporter substrate-binding protein
MMQPRQLRLKRRQVLKGLGALPLVAAHPSWAQPTGKPIPVRIGLQAQTSWLLYAARELKLFEKAGLEPAYVKLTTGAQSIAAVQGKSLDIASPGITPFVAGLALGVNWKVVGIDTTLPEAEGFVARKDAGIEKLEDLKGKTVAVARGSTSYYGLLAALKSKGLGKDDVKLLLMGPPEQLGAMHNSNIDAVAVWEPWIQRQIKETGARLIGMEADYGVHTALAIYAVEGDFAQQSPAAVDRFLEGLLLAYNHVQKNGPDVPIAAVASAMGISKELATTMYKEAPAPVITRWTDPGYQYSIAKGGPFEREAQQMADFLFDEKIIDRKADLSQSFDPSYIARVLSRARK